MKPASLNSNSIASLVHSHAPELISMAYRGILDREPDQDGIRHYTRRMRDGTELAQVLKELAGSEELRSRLDAGHAPVNVDPKDVFDGLRRGDAARIQSLCDPAKGTVEGVFIDPLGVKVAPAYYPWIADRVGTRHNAVPIPNDSYFAESIEYAALALAFEMTPGRDRFTVAEIGAGWGPWVSASTVVARRLGFRFIDLVAFEADEARFRALRSHLALNSIVPLNAPAKARSGSVSWELHNVAADHQDRTLFWPAEGGVDDAGMAAVSELPNGTDYRGKDTQYREIPARDFRTVLSAFDVVDFMHIDIQGAEYDLIMNTLPFLEERIRCIFVGTHDRKIEGNLIAELRNRGWTLLRERPCQFDLESQAPTLTGMTYVDGGQFWRTPLAR